MNTMFGMIPVENVPASHEKFVVARKCENQLWYWGSWSTQSAADEAAAEIDGLVIIFSMSARVVCDNVYNCCEVAVEGGGTFTITLK